MTVKEHLARVDSRLAEFRQDWRRREAQLDHRWAEGERRWEERDRWRSDNERMSRRFHDELLKTNARITEDLIAAIGVIRAEVEDSREQIQANTRAVLRLLDERFGPEPGEG